MEPAACIENDDYNSEESFLFTDSDSEYNPNHDLRSDFEPKFIDSAELQQDKEISVASTSNARDRGQRRSRNRARVANQNENRMSEGDTWNDVDVADVSNDIPPFVPHRTPGVHLPPITREWTPFRIFELFFPMSLVTQICAGIQMHVEGLHRKLKYSLPNNFGPDLFYAFLGAIIHMGLAPRQDIRDFWSRSSLGDPFLIKSAISRKVFHSILWAIKDYEDVLRRKNENEPNDRLTKLRLMVNSIAESCKRYMAPQREICVHKRLVTCKSNDFFKQRVPKKSGKRSFKLWVAACPHTGYTHYFKIHTCKNSSNVRKKRLSHSMFLNLMKPYTHYGHIIYMDNFYANQDLFENLFSQKTLCVGAVRRNRWRYHGTALNKLTPKSDRGAILWCRNQRVLYIQWLGSRGVQMATTLHTGNAVTSVSRPVFDPSDGKMSSKDILQPQCIADYNRFVGGAHLTSQYFQAYNWITEPPEWYKNLFFYIMNIAVTNAHIIYQEVQKSRGGKILSIKNFRLGLSDFLIELSRLRRISASLMTPKESRLHLPVLKPRRLKCVVCARDHKVGRKTNFFCEVCKIALCLTRERNCFKIYHTKVYW